MIALVIATTCAGSGAAGMGVPSAASRAQVPLTGPRAAPEKCPDARRAVAYYRAKVREHRARMGAGEPLERHLASRPRKPRNCADARYLARVWRVRALVVRRELERWILRRLQLIDFPFRSGNHAWPRAVEQVQRPFPGTASWLLSCSAAEGGHGRWVGYGGQGYSTWLRDSDTVGGPLQFRYSTFTGMFRRGLEYVRARGYRVPPHLRYVSDVAWRSALGQAIAGGWARYTGNDNSHWSASWGRGC